MEQSSAAGPLESALLRTVIAALGIVNLVQGIVMVAAPGTFFSEVAAYGTQNDHYIRDVATLNIALGIALLVAVQRASWRVPVLAFAALQFVLHAVNHLFDIGESDPGWIGPFNFVSLAAIAGVIGWALYAAAREERAR